MIDCKHNDCIFYPDRKICCLAEVIQGRTINCPNYERENMSSIKITAEVDGKQIPLENISTETFEAIKALEKSKEIPVARLAEYGQKLRLLFKPTENVCLEVGKIYSLDLRQGDVATEWSLEDDDNRIYHYRYKNIKPL